MKNNKRIAVAVAVVLGLVAVWAGWGAVQVGAGTPPDDSRIAFGMVGITFGQMGRLNVVYVAPDGAEKRRSDPEWVVRLQFLDARGEVIAERTVGLMPGRAAFLDVPFDTHAREDERMQIRGNIIDMSGNKGTLIGTVEVFDSETGRTQFILGDGFSVP